MWTTRPSPDVSTKEEAIHGSRKDTAAESQVHLEVSEIYDRPGIEGSLERHQMDHQPLQDQG